MNDSRELDRFGFLTTKQNTNRDLLQENARIEKWEKMLRNWPRYTGTKFSKLKKRIRKGIPPVFRGRIWCLLSDIESIKETYPKDYYSNLLNLEVQKTVDTEISVDLNRTFPNNVMFRTNEGKNALYRVLRAYATMDPEVSYTQGMSFIVAAFLMYVSEEEAFWLLVALITQHEFRGFFIQGMPKVYNFFYIGNGLLRHFVPQVFKKFRGEKISITMYATQWFMTGFLCFLPIESSLRIWDCFWCEGVKVFFRVFLGLIMLKKSSFVKGSFETILGMFRDLGSDLDSDELLKFCFKISLKSKLVSRLERDYLKGPKAKYIDWVSVKH